MVPIIVSIIVPLFLYFLNKASKKKVSVPVAGNAELRMNVMYRIIAVAGFLMGLMSLLMPVLADEYSVEIFMVSGFMFLLFVGVSVPVFLWHKNHHVSFNQSGLVSTSAYGSKQYVAWDNIDKVKFSAFMGVLQVIDKQGKVAKVHQHLIGFSSFVKTLQNQKSKYKFDSEDLPLKMLGLDK